MLIVCKKCGIEHDVRDINNGICVWCEQKENNEGVVLQSPQQYPLFIKRVDRKHNTRYTRYSK